MADVVRAALVQQKWTGDKDSMVKNAVAAIRDAAAQGARVTCLQELFYGPYFCQVQEPEWYSWAEAVPDGPTVRLMCDVAREHQMVLIVPVYELEQEGVLYNTAAVIDADGTFLGKRRGRQRVLRGHDQPGRRRAARRQRLLRAVLLRRPARPDHGRGRLRHRRGGRRPRPGHGDARRCPEPV